MNSDEFEDLLDRKNKLISKAIALQQDDEEMDPQDLDQLAMLGRALPEEIGLYR